ncbi:MAG: hypothetical protein MUC50_22150 [Myxococcota bacterium]|nr:hypothetical protein [Myxococcota bacterium]
MVAGFGWNEAVGLGSDIAGQYLKDAVVVIHGPRLRALLLSVEQSFEVENPAQTHGQSAISEALDRPMKSFLLESSLSVAMLPLVVSKAPKPNQNQHRDRSRDHHGKNGNRQLPAQYSHVTEHKHGQND